MSNIGEPVRRHTVIPLTEPVPGPEHVTPLPSVPTSPEPNPIHQPSPTPEYEPAR